MRIAVFGGTFNPPHLGHMAAAKACVEQLELDRLLLMPTAIPPHKVLPQGSATAEQRLEMCRIAAAAIPCCRACGLELEREGPSYTADTMALLAEKYPGDQLWLVVGTDMLQSFPRWREPERIVRVCRLAAVAREAGDEEKIARTAQALREGLGAQVDVIRAPALPASSTQVRAGEKAGLLDPGVAEYIREKELYLPTLEALREAVRPRMSEKRFRHTLGCEKLAAEMALRFGAEEYTVRAAAILHDCTKGLSEKEQLTLAEKWHIIFDYEAADFARLIHADTGAETARREFLMPDRVCDAIRTHTVGGPGIATAEQKILYVADLCEETRSFEGIEPLRALARTDLEAAFTAGLARTVEYIKKQGKTPYHVTEEVLQARLRESRDPEKEEQSMAEMTPKELMEHIVRIADGKKARDIVVMKVDDRTTLTDYFVIMTGTSTTHIRALGDEIEEQMKKQHGLLPHHREGVTSSWVLVDYTSVVVNIFQQEAREMYALERLWGDGTRIDITNLTKED